MGAWGEGPFDSDASLDWIGDKIEHPIIRAIKNTLESFLAKPKTRIPVLMIDHKQVAIDSIRPKPKKAKKRARLTLLKTPTKRVMMDGRRGYRHHDVEAAAAILDKLTPYSRRRDPWVSIPIRRGKKKLPRFKKLKKAPPEARFMWGDTGVEFRLNYQAENQHLYSLGVKAIEGILEDDAYLSSWRSRTMKVLALKELKKKLAAKIPNERPERIERHKKPVKGWVRNPRRKAK